MPFARPTLKELIDRAVADVESRLPGTDAHLRRSAARALATTHAGAMHGAYGHQAYLAKQIIPDKAEKEYLIRWAGLWGITIKAAASAKGQVDFTGTNTTIIPVATAIKRSDGVEYTTDAEVTIAAGVATADATATEAGTGGNTDAGTKVTLATPIAGIDSEATVAAGGINNGTAQETEASLLARLLARIQKGKPNGRAGDYATWAKEISGITRAWDYPLYLGGGTVGCTFVLDNQIGTIIPNAPKVTEVQDYLDSKAPVDATVTAFAPVAVPLDFTITLTPNTAAVQAAAQAELEDLILRKAEPGGTILLSQIREAISLAEGETDHILSVPAANDVQAFGDISIMGVITWA